MSIVPAGFPAWIRANSHAEYGGHVDKANWMSQGVVNLRTDVGAEAFSRMAADLEAVHRVAPFAVLRVLCNDSVPAAPTIVVAHAMNGVREVSYEGDVAPAGFPSAARNGDSDVTLTWASSYTDPYGIAGDINITNAKAGPIEAVARNAVCELVSGLVVRVRVFVPNTAVLAQNAQFSLKVWTGG